MKIIKILIITVSCIFAEDNLRTIHILVPLCNSEHDGMVSVSTGCDYNKPETNLFWGAIYGIKTFFKADVNNWEHIQDIQYQGSHILERSIFKHKKQNVTLIADAYNGKMLDVALIDFYQSLDGTKKENFLLLDWDFEIDVDIYGSSDLIIFVGQHKDIEYQFNSKTKSDIETMILTCFSQLNFCDAVSNTSAIPLLLTTNAIAPEAYSIKGALDVWINNRDSKEILDEASMQYNNYQNCGIKAAKSLFTTSCP
tara:strand:- start:429 stop:1190 length:762 start_codon:yes stop_codon:yes gene_type:complete